MIADFLISLNKGIFPGIAIFIAIVTFPALIYQIMYNEQEREKHKKILLKKLNNFSKILFNQVGKKQLYFILIL